MELRPGPGWSVEEILRPGGQTALLELQLRSLLTGNLRRPPGSAAPAGAGGDHLAQLRLCSLVLRDSPASQASHAGDRLGSLAANPGGSEWEHFPRVWSNNSRHQRRSGVRPQPGQPHRQHQQAVPLQAVRGDVRPGYPGGETGLCRHGRLLLSRSQPGPVLGTTPSLQSRHLADGILSTRGRKLPEVSPFHSLMTQQSGLRRVFLSIKV